MRTQRNVSPAGAWAGRTAPGVTLKGPEQSPRAASGLWSDSGKQAHLVGHRQACLLVGPWAGGCIPGPWLRGAGAPLQGHFRIYSQTEVDRPFLPGGRVSRGVPWQMVLQAGSRLGEAAAKSTGAVSRPVDRSTVGEFATRTCACLLKMALLSFSPHQGFSVSCRGPTTRPRRHFGL